MCACTEPVRIGIGAVCVEYGRPKWPITMLNHTYRIMFCFFIFDTLCSYCLLYTSDAADDLTRGDYAGYMLLIWSNVSSKQYATQRNFYQQKR